MNSNCQHCNQEHFATPRALCNNHTHVTPLAEAPGPSRQRLSHNSATPATAHTTAPAASADSQDGIFSRDPDLLPLRQRFGCRGLKNITKASFIHAESPAVKPTYPYHTLASVELWPNQRARGVIYEDYKTLTVDDVMRLLVFHDIRIMQLRNVDLYRQHRNFPLAVFWQHVQHLMLSARGNTVEQVRAFNLNLDGLKDDLTAIGERLAPHRFVNQTRPNVLSQEEAVLWKAIIDELGAQPEELPPIA